MDEYNLKDEIKRLRERVEGVEEKEKKKEKKFKLPSKARLNRKNLKDNYVTVLYLKNNRTAEFMKLPIDESSTMVNGIPRIATADEVLYLDGKTPLIIQPEWSVKPFSPSDNYEEAVKMQLTSEGYTVLINRMKKEAIATKKKMPGWIIIVIIAVIGIAGFFLLGGTKLIGLK